MTHDDFLDDGTAERILDGAVAPADAPPGYGPVADLLAAARGGVTAPTPDLEVLASAARDAAGHSDPRPNRRSPVLAKLLSLKAAAAAGVIVLGATSAAAATGALPGAAQGVAHDTFSHVGVHLPDDDATEHAKDPAHDATEPADDATTTTTAPADPGVPVPPAGDPSDPGTEPDEADGAHHDHGHDPAGDQGDDATDDHGGTAATPPPTTGGDAGHDGEPGDGSGSGSDGSGSGDGSGAGDGGGSSGTGGHGSD